MGRWVDRWMGGWVGGGIDRWGDEWMEEKLNTLLEKPHDSSTDQSLARAHVQKQEADCL